MSYLVKWMSEHKNILNDNFMAETEIYLKKCCIISEIERQQYNIENIYIPKSKKLIKELAIKTNSMDMSERKIIREIKNEMSNLEKKIKYTESYRKSLCELLNKLEEKSKNIEDSDIIFFINDIDINYNQNQQNIILDFSEEQFVLLEETNIT